MISDEQVRRIALFFLFTLMDEKIALQAAHKTVAHLKATSARGLSELNDGEIVAVLRKTHEQHRKLVSRGKQLAPTEATLTLPDKTDLASWTKFQKETGENEVVAVVLSKVLGFGDEAIAEGLSISVGTARYRIGKGVRHLGALMARA